MNIDEKIAAALHLYRLWADVLRSDAAVSRGLGALVAASEASREASTECGVSETCRRCDEQEGGSCCGAGIEDRYTPELLLINLLLRAELPIFRRSRKSCHFLGERGCILPARDIICINYLCARARDAMPQKSLIHLQETAGREMETLFVLHDLIRKMIRCRI